MFVSYFGPRQLPHKYSYTPISVFLFSLGPKIPQKHLCGRAAAPKDQNKMKFISVEIDLHWHFYVVLVVIFAWESCSFLLIFGHVLKIFNAKTAQRDETGRPGRFIKISSSTFCLFSHCVHDAMKWKSMQMHSPQHHGNNYNDNEDEWAWWWWWRWVWGKRTFCHWSAHRGNEHFAPANGDRL